MAKQLGNQEIIGDGSNPSLVIDTTAFIVTETGNVGIGTNVPNTKLHTFGQISADKNSGDTAIVDTSIPFYAIRQNTGAPDYYSGLQFAFEVGGGIWGTAYDYASNYYQLLGVSNTKFGFGYGNSNSATYSMTIDNSNGNVGIGNNTPAYKLHVVGTTRFSGSSVFGAPASDIIANKINLDLAYKIAFDGLDALYYDLATDATVLKGGANNIIKFMGTIELARFAEDSAPYFSIGSTDMLATVYVKSAGAGTALRVDGNSIASILTVADNGRIGILNDTPSYDFDSNAATNTFRNRVLVDYIQSVYFPNTSGTTTQITLGSNVTVMSRGELGVAYDTFIVNTPTTLTTTGANLLAVYNNSVGRLIVSKDGDTYIAGNTGIGLDTFGAKLHVKSSSGIAFRVDGPSVNNILQVLQDANGYGSTYTANSKALFDATDWYPSVYGRNTVTNRLFVAQGNPTIPSYSTMVGTWHTSMFDSAIFAYSSSNNYMTLATSSHTSTTGIIMGDDNESLAMSLSKRGNAYVGNFAGSSITQASAAIWGDYYGKQIITGSVGQEIYFLNPTDSYYSYHFNGFGLLMDNKATIHNTAAAMIHLKLRQYPPAGYQSRIMRLENLTDYSSISLPETQAPLFEIINNPTEPGTPSNLTGNIFQINDMINSYYNLIRVEKNGSLRMKLDKDGKMLLSDADYQGTYDISCGGSVISKARLMVDSALDGYSTIMLQGKGGLGGNAGENAIYLGDSYKAFAAIKSSTQSPFKEGNIDFYTTPDNTATGLQKRMTINKDGFVGIGTTVQQSFEKLGVNGMLYVEQGINLGGYVGGFNNNTIHFSNDGNLSWGGTMRVKGWYDSGSGGSNTDIRGYQLIFLNTASGTEFARFDGGTMNMGIGITTSISAKLHIVSTSGSALRIDTSSLNNTLSVADTSFVGIRTASRAYDEWTRIQGGVTIDGVTDTSSGLGYALWVDPNDISAGQRTVARIRGGAVGTAQSGTGHGLFMDTGFAGLNEARTITISNLGTTNNYNYGVYSEVRNGIINSIGLYGASSGGDSITPSGFKAGVVGQVEGLGNTLYGGKFVGLNPSTNGATVYGVHASVSTEGATTGVNFVGGYFSASGGATAYALKTSGNINMGSLPTSAAGLVSGDLWNNSGVINIV